MSPIRLTACYMDLLQTTHPLSPLSMVIVLSKQQPIQGTGGRLSVKIMARAKNISRVGVIGHVKMH